MEVVAEVARVAGMVAEEVEIVAGVMEVAMVAGVV